VEELSSEKKDKIVKFSIPPIKCKTCEVLNAKWYNTLSNEYSCDECVPRGCSCRLQKKPDASGCKIDDYDYTLDKHKRELPCEDWTKI
jgi:hypothetical protein